MATPETKSPRLFVAAMLGAMALQPLHAEVPEPETVFYGKIVNRSSGQMYQVTSGTLQVTVAGEGIPAVELTSQIQPHADGKYSYVLKMPHQAKSLDLNVEAGQLPLHTSDRGFENISIRVDGQVARPLGSNSTLFTASQPKRGEAHRLDLEVFTDLEDTDEDGIPDWWEELYGLDKQDPLDAAERWGDNFYTYRQAYDLGLNPLTDDRVPALLTSEVLIMENGATGLLLRTVASTSTPAQIVYRITSLPDGGDLVLRNARPDPVRSHRKLLEGESFSQADLDAGLVEFIHEDPTVSTTALEVAISSSDPEMEPVEGEVAFNVYRPVAAEGRGGEAWLSETFSLRKNDSVLGIWTRRATEAFADDWTGGALQQDWIAAFLLARWHGYTVWDGTAEMPARNIAVPSAGMSAADYKKSFVKSFGPARKHVLFAGHGESRIEGGMNDDVLIAGNLKTALKGNAGADIFVVSENQTTIEDYKSAEGDLLDLSRILKGWPGPLDEKMEISLNAGNTWLTFALSDEDEAVVILKGLNLTAKQVEALRKKGRFFSGAQAGAALATNRSPEAVADEGYVVAGQPVSISVLANDYDPDGDSLTLSGVTQGTAGTVQILNSVVVYQPGPGFAGSDSFTYTVNDGRNGTATGKVAISYPYPAAAGTYITLAFDTEGAPIGQLTLTLLRTGHFSAKLNFGGINYAGKGVFGASGAALVTLKGGKGTVDVALTIDLGDPEYPLTGTVTGGTLAGTLAVSFATANARLAPTVIKRYTVMAQPPEGDTALRGHSIATMTVSKTYIAKIAGRLADGTAFTASSKQDKTGGIHWTRKLYKGGGWVLGQMSVADSGGQEPTAALKWSKPDGAEPAFVAALPAQISLYLPPTATTVSVFDFPNGTDRKVDFEMQDGGLLLPVEQVLTLGNSDRVTPVLPVKKLAIKRPSGLFTGTALVDGASYPVQGVILQNANAGYGFFLNAPSSGSVKLLPK
ncbi:Ig-like domain-containing protein [Prosthecobacter sp. SYSU 5D2]|uniref:Ig-like domain-containing protein n=1 Tax=Prosthecobacter sp. SYSU 5D2 TaxID=3134134 RepID=UPI0031FE87A5